MNTILEPCVVVYVLRAMHSSSCVCFIVYRRAMCAAISQMTVSTQTDTTGKDTYMPQFYMCVKIIVIVYVPFNKYVNTMLNTVCLLAYSYVVFRCFAIRSCILQACNVCRHTAICIAMSYMNM